MLIHVLRVALLAVTLTSALSEKFLTEKPADLVPCSTKDPKFNKCLVKNLQTIFINWKDGIPGSDIVGPIDPFTINFDFWTKLFGSELSSLGIDINFTDIVVKGMSQAVITEASYDPSKYEAKVAFNIPKLSFYFEYTVQGNGSTNNVQLYSKDDGTIELSDLLLEYEMTLKPRVTPEGTFFDVEHLKGDFKDVAKNDLDESIVEKETSLIDIDWRELYRSFQEFYGSPHESLLLDRVKKDIKLYSSHLYYR
ncbi:uncharacterized protein LOC132786114 [Drosophila nasuta]|uniref:uncharacterized protein LOC132786114 n=1 Tax=Drosophila nasuta TaxID=42062 RepID=UPI00295EB1F7|nr:uncharacterized protein LOC132786114 [Drosophila nasuta]